MHGGPEEEPIDLDSIPAVTALVVPPSAALVRAQDAADLKEILREGHRASSTLEAYAADWKRFVAWASKRGTPVPTHAAADVLTLSVYLATHGGRITTIERALSGILYVYNQNGGELMYRAHPLIKETMARCRLGSGDVTQKQPLTESRLQLIVPHLPSLQLRAIVLVGLLAARRRSEIVTLDTTDVTFTPEGLRVQIGGRSKATGEIRRSKTDQKGKGFMVGIFRQENEKLCAVVALQKWIEARRKFEGASSPALFCNRLGRRVCGRTVARAVKNACEAAGLDPADFSGHSLRSGLVTEASAQGRHDDAIMRQTGHRSREVLDGYKRHDVDAVFRDNVTKDLFRKKGPDGQV